MKAIVVDPKAPDFALKWETVADPLAGPGEVLVDIHATAVNRADLLQRQGLYPPPPGTPPYMGLEMAGTVAETGEQAGDWKKGDRVCALLAGGGYAEQVAVPQELLTRLPDDWDFVKGAAFPEVFYTAYVNLFNEAELQAGETVLIHGGASGVGTAAIQLAKAAGCRVAVTASSPEKLARCRQLGADIAINYKEEDFAEALLGHCDGADVVLDIAAAPYLERHLKLLKPKGRLVVIALLGGARAEVDLAAMLVKRLRLIGSVLRSRSLAEKKAIVDGFKQRFWPLLVEGAITPVIETVMPLQQVEAAHAILQQNRNIGKVILRVRD
jgi:putative PIG3 family NAD(P)H quinone oxidoreductase